MPEAQEPKSVPESYAREYWAWVDSELDADWDQDFDDDDAVSGMGGPEA